MNDECQKCKGSGGWWHGYGGNETEEICELCGGCGEVDEDGE